MVKDCDLALQSPQHAEQAQEQFLLALPVEAPQPDDFTLADAQVDAFELAFPGELVDRQIGGFRRRLGFRRIVRGHLAADHQLDDLALAMRALGESLDVLAVAEHREHVAQLVDLVHAVGNEQACHAGRPEFRKQAVDGFHIAAGQRRRGFVENEHLRILAERLGDFDHLSARQRQLAHQRVGIDILALDPRQQFLGTAVLRPLVDQPEPGARRCCDGDVVGDRQVGHQRQFLKDTDDARCDRLFRI